MVQDIKTRVENLNWDVIGKLTHKMGLQALYRNLEMEEWYHPSVYQMVYKRMRQYFSEDELFISQMGFEP
ncbi:hypothetical protein LIS82_06990 [Cytobacillus solani]|uniref:hypothetical protein n=1 Tax=Cytobacillus solani TaxID=1637975 RepID=UPI00207AEDD1|nr:hypothetical protein [Cytobacillus solani]USK56218.1 hypothetical protein LIS82_06990 [Cytobacillus solani]